MKLITELLNDSITGGYLFVILITVIYLVQIYV